MGAVQDMGGITMPIGLFDPLGFSNGASAEALQWYREAELKHGRVAMAAFVGFLVNYQGITFPADLTMSGEKFSSLGTGNPLLAWDNISDKGKWSILGFIGLLEVLGEAEKPHYMRGGKSGTHDLVWYFGSKYLSGKTEEQKLRSRTAEINNGRLAMIGIMGFIAVDGAGLGPVLHGGPHAVLRLGLGAILSACAPRVSPPKKLGRVTFWRL